MGADGIERKRKYTRRLKHTDEDLDRLNRNWQDRLDRAIADVEDINKYLNKANRNLQDTLDIAETKIQALIHSQVLFRNQVLALQSKQATPLDKLA